MDSTARRTSAAPTIPADDSATSSAIDDLLDGLEVEPEESWNAFLGLESLDAELRRSIVAARPAPRWGPTTGPSSSDRHEPPRRRP